MKKETGPVELEPIHEPEPTPGPTPEPAPVVVVEDVCAQLGTSARLDAV